MKKTTRLILTLFLLLASILAGCGGRAGPSPTQPPITTGPAETVTPAPGATLSPGPTPTDATLRGTISLWHAWDEAQRPALLRRIEAFQKLYPDVLFDVQYVPSVDLLAAFEAAVIEGSGPAILLGPAEWGPALYYNGLVADLAGLAKDGLVQHFNPAALDAGRYQQALVGLPVSQQGVVLYRNQEIIPIAPRTYEELVSMAKSATRGEVIGAILERGFLYSGAHLSGLGGSLVAENGDPGFNNEEGVEWLNLLQSFVLAGPVEYLTDNDLQVFIEGRAGFIIDGTWNWPALAEAIGSQNLSIDPWPIYGKGQLSGFVQTENVYLRTPGPAGEDLALPWAFVEFFLSPDSQAGLLEVGLIPAVVPADLPPVEADPLVYQAMQALAGGTAYPVGLDASLYATTLDAALLSVFSGGALPAEALQSAFDTIQASRSGLSGTPTPEP